MGHSVLHTALYTQQPYTIFDELFLHKADPCLNSPRTFDLVSTALICNTSKDILRLILEHQHAYNERIISMLGHYQSLLAPASAAPVLASHTITKQPRSPFSQPRRKGQGIRVYEPAQPPLLSHQDQNGVCSEEQPMQQPPQSAPVVAAPQPPAELPPPPQNIEETLAHDDHEDSSPTDLGHLCSYSVSKATRKALFRSRFPMCSKNLDCYSMLYPDQASLYDLNAIDFSCILDHDVDTLQLLLDYNEKFNDQAQHIRHIQSLLALTTSICSAMPAGVPLMAQLFCDFPAGCLLVFFHYMKTLWKLILSGILWCVFVVMFGGPIASMQDSHDAQRHPSPFLRAIYSDLFAYALRLASGDGLESHDPDDVKSPTSLFNPFCNATCYSTPHGAEKLAMLLENHHPIKFRPDSLQRSPLHYAVAYDKPEILEGLLDAFLDQRILCDE